MDHARTLDLINADRVVSGQVLARTKTPGGMRKGNLYLMPHFQDQNHFCIKTVSDKSHFDVSVIVRTKSQDGVHELQLLKKNGERK